MRRSGQGIRAQVGLSMIEVMAAMVIFSTGAVILFGWIAQMATRLSTLEVEQARLFAELSALEFTRSLNPMLQGKGASDERAHFDVADSFHVAAPMFEDLTPREVDVLQQLAKGLANKEIADVLTGLTHTKDSVIFCDFCMYFVFTMRT